MTNEEAIKYLIPPIATSTEPSAEYLKQKEAYELAIKALKRPTGDLISREALKRDLASYDREFVPDWVLNRIDNAPTVEAYPFEQVQELVKLNQQFAQEIANMEISQGVCISQDKRAPKKPLWTFCDRCGTCNRLDYNFCHNCGAKMKGDANV